MEEKNVPEFKRACKEVLLPRDITMLRAYGRFLQLKCPTKLRKDVLIKEIIEVLYGESKPQRNKKGKPPKNSYVDPSLIEEINELKKEYLLEDVETPSKTEKESPLLTETLLQLSINPSSLNEKQKQLLNDFLNSL